MKIDFFVLIIFCISVLFSGCSKSSVNDPVELNTYSFEKNSILSAGNITGLEVENPRGGLILYGTGISDTISYILSKTIKAEDKDKAEAQKDNIELFTELTNDTLHCSVLYPLDTDYLESYGYLDMYVPRELPVVIRNMVEGIYINDMRGDLKVRNAKDHIDIWRHSGSCDVRTIKGDLNIEIALPGGGYCKAATDEGDIILKVNSQASASIYAKTIAGTVICYGLNISNLNHSSGLLTGQIGTGVGEIRLETEIGNIEISGF